MSDVVLVLGPVAFADFEVPERIVFGGRQSMAVHRLPGGARVIDTMGRDDGEIVFSGVFSGSLATERARVLDVLRVSGAVLPLTWDVFFYSVIIARFEAEYRHSWWIPFRIACTVLRDEAEALLGEAVSLAFDGAADLASAAGFLASGGIDVSAAQAALAAPDATTLGTANYTAATSSVAAAEAGAASGVANADPTLATNYTQLAAAGDAPGGIAALDAATSASGQAAALTAQQGYLGRVTTNLANASS